MWYYQGQRASHIVCSLPRIVGRDRGTVKTRCDHPHRVQKTPGSDLLSHGVTPAVPSAEEGLTTVFGMGTGVSPLL